MEHVRGTDVDSQDAIAKTFNDAIDNMNTLEARILELIAVNKSVEKHNAEVDKFNADVGFEKG
jgi:hypothetical protein